MNIPISVGMLGCMLVIAVLLTVNHRYGIYLCYAIGLIIVWSITKGNELYFYALVVGLVAAYVEIIGKFPDEPTKALGTRVACVYLFTNGLMAAFSVKLILLNDLLPNKSESDQLTLVLAAGLGSMLVMRSKFFNIKVGGEDISVGPEQIIKVFFQYMERAIDRVRATSRVDFIKAVMNNINFEDIYDYTVTMLHASQVLPVNVKTELEGQIKNLRDEEPDDPQLKSYQLGFLLLNRMGEDFVSQLFGSPRPSWFIRAPQRQFPFMRTSIKYFAYGTSMVTDTLVKRFQLPDTLAKPILNEEPKPASLNKYRLVFNKPSAHAPFAEGLASIEPDQDEVVEGVVYRLPKDVVEYLNKFDKGYKKIRIDVTIAGKQSEAYTFVADTRRNGLKPSQAHLDSIIKAAEAHHLGQEYIEQLRGVDPLPPKPTHVQRPEAA